MLAANELYDALCGKRVSNDPRQIVFVRHSGRAGAGPVTARIQREADGGWFVRVRPHEQSPAERAEIAEQVEALLAVETAPAAGVRLGRRLVALLSPEDAKDASRSWLEGCIWSAARASGLDWDPWHCATVADVVRAVGGAKADPAGGDTRRSG